jgi:hypothetical protein
MRRELAAASYFASIVLLVVLVVLAVLEGAARKKVLDGCRLLAYIRSRQNSVSAMRGV